MTTINLYDNATNVVIGKGDRAWDLGLVNATPRKSNIPNPPPLVDGLEGKFLTLANGLRHGYPDWACGRL